MAIPSYWRIMLPFLRFLDDMKEHSLLETIEHISNEFKLSNDERKQLFSSLPSQPFSRLIQAAEIAIAWVRQLFLKRYVRASLIQNPNNKKECSK
jgi:restriction endonuclease Mrr